MTSALDGVRVLDLTSETTLIDWMAGEGQAEALIGPQYAEAFGSLDIRSLCDAEKLAGAR